MQELVGQLLAGRYRVTRALGEERAWRVYRAQDERRSIPVLLKVLPDDLANDSLFLRRFRELVNPIKRLEHPHLVPFYGFEQTREHAFLILGEVAGTSLAEYLQQCAKPLPLAKALLVLRAVCAALRHAHAHGSYHGDLRPTAVALSPDGQVLVTDFGIAESIRAATGGKIVPGDPAYMAPEQRLGQGGDARTDIFQLALLLCQMLTGAFPLGGVSGFVSEPLNTRQGKQEYASEKVLQGLPDALRAGVMKALAKDPADRQSTVEDFFREVSGSELAFSYPPTPVLAQSKEAKGEADDLRRAAARLVAFFSSDAPQVAAIPEKAPASLEEESAEPTATSAPVTEPDEQPRAPTKAPSEIEREHYVVRWSDLERKRQWASAVLREAGTRIREGQWDKARALCEQVLAEIPNHAAAQALAAEVRASALQDLYNRAERALREGKREVAMALLRRLLEEDASHQPALELLNRLQKSVSTPKSEGSI